MTLLSAESWGMVLWNTVNWNTMNWHAIIFSWTCHCLSSTYQANHANPTDFSLHTEGAISFYRHRAIYLLSTHLPWSLFPSVICMYPNFPNWVFHSLIQVITQWLQTHGKWAKCSWKTSDLIAKLLNSLVNVLYYTPWMVVFRFSITEIKNPRSNILLRVMTCRCLSLMKP